MDKTKKDFFCLMFPVFFRKNCCLFVRLSFCLDFYLLLSNRKLYSTISIYLCSMYRKGEVRVRLKPGPSGFYQDPDPTSEKKPDPDPTLKKNT